MASTMAKWGNKKWKITTSKLNPVDEVSYSMSFNSEEGKKEKRTVKVPYTVYKEFGVNVQQEIDDWYMFLGKSNPLYFGKKRFGPKKLKLTAVDVSEVKVSDTGVVRSASFSLSLTEP